MGRKKILIREIKLWQKYNDRNKCIKQKAITLKKSLNAKKMMFVMLLWTVSANKLQLHRNQTWMSFEFRANRLKRKFFVVWIQKYAIYSSLRRRELQLMASCHHKIVHDVF